MGFAEGELHVRRGLASTQAGCQGTLRASLALRDPNLPTGQAHYRYELPALDAVGPYETCGGCGGRIVPLERGFHKCDCTRWHPAHVIPRSPSPMQILRARVLLRRALRKRFEQRLEAAT